MNGQIARLLTPLGLVVAASLLSVASPGASAMTGDVLRVGGDAEAAVEARVGPDGLVSWHSGSCRITTALPDGYPRPTPPGALEIKRVPEVRRAVVKGSEAGQRGAFWPLFQHIQERNIAMTSPVEMDYRGLRPGGEGELQDWTMAFLYRSPDLGPTGRDGRVAVEDTEPVTVLSIGVRGPYEGRRYALASEALAAWLAESDEWEAAGDLRAFHYNGPSVPSRDKWGELQVPVRPRESR